MPKRPVSIINQLPALDKVESEVRRYAREARLLRSLRDALRRKSEHEQALVDFRSAIDARRKGGRS
jgi:primosomal protein N'